MMWHVASRGWARFRRVARCSLALATLAGCRQLDFPEPPDLSDIEALYDAPTRRIDTPAEAAEAAAAAAVALLVIDRVGTFDFVFNTLYEALERLQRRFPPPGPGGGTGTGDSPRYRISGDGVFEMRTACLDLGEQGAFELSGSMRDLVFDKSFFGPAVSCVYETETYTTREPVRVQADGQIAVITRDRIPLSPPPGYAFPRAIVYFDGTLRLGERRTVERVHFEVGETTLLRIALAEGDAGTVFFFFNEDGETGIDAANGRWSCNLETLRCAAG